MTSAFASRAGCAAPDVSVVVVSRGRPNALTLCLTALAQQEDIWAEVIVVACPEGLRALACHPIAPHIVAVPCETANISAARNLGWSRARSDIVAFVDDDAIPEPTWLAHLTEPFQDPAVLITGGHVIGRNGITRQWGDRAIDAWGQSHAFHPALRRRVEGTNMALRRVILCRLGGFDPAFRFYHDDTDLIWRADLPNDQIVYVPRAVVHHATAPSPVRRADRSPRTLHEIAASQVVFQRKHTPLADHPRAWNAFVRDQSARLMRHLQRGTLGPEEVAALCRTLAAGAAEAHARVVPGPSELPGPLPATGPVLPMRPRARRVLIVGWLWQARALTRVAQQHLARGCQVTVLRFSPTTLYHHVRFMPEGYWLQSGGLFGRSVRTSAMVRIISRERRSGVETHRIAELRGDSPDFEIVFVDSFLRA